MEKKMQPNAIAALVLGIVSCACGCFCAGLIVGIIGLVTANKGMRDYEANPDLYNGHAMLKAGKITSIVGIILGILSIIFWIIYFVGIIALATNPDFIEELF